MKKLACFVLLSMMSFGAGAENISVPLGATKTIEWKLPDGATCGNGRPIVECPVSGWEIQTSTAEHEPFRVLRGYGVGTTSLTFTVTEPVCYRVRSNNSKADGGFSAPSNHLCFIPTKPTTGYTPPAPVLTEKK